MLSSGVKELSNDELRGLVDQLLAEVAAPRERVAELEAENAALKEVAHTPEEFADKLEAFGAAQSTKHKLDIDTAAYPSHDPAVHLDQKLMAADRENRPT